jgi:hypothetical protein
MENVEWRMKGLHSPFSIVRRFRAILAQARWTSPQHLRRRPVRYVLSITSVAMAVALFVSMRITQVSLVSAFRTGLDALAGGAEHTITGRDGVAPEALAAIERVAGVRAAPLVRGPAVLADARQAVTLLGIDAARDLRLRAATARPRNSSSICRRFSCSRRPLLFHSAWPVSMVGACDQRSR